MRHSLKSMNSKHERFSFLNIYKLERANKFIFTQLQLEKMGLDILWTKVPIDVQINRKTVQKNFWKQKTKKLSTQPHDNLEFQVIHLWAQTKNVQVEAVHLKLDHLCMQE
jgi:hypothetical protein